MKLRSRRNEMIALVVLGLGAIYGVYSSFFSGPPTSTVSTPPARTVPSADESLPQAARDTETQAARPAASRNGEFVPVLRSKNPANRMDVSRVDPALRTDLLSKVQHEDLGAGGRNLFQFGATPPPKVEVAKALPGPGPQVPVFHPVGPRAPEPPKPPGPPPPPPPIIITFKYYGFFTERDNGKKTAFLLDGDEILTASEGQTVKKHYKIVRIGVNSLLVEDTQLQRTQSVPITPEEVTAG